MKYLFYMPLLWPIKKYLFYMPIFRAIYGGFNLCLFKKVFHLFFYKKCHKILINSFKKYLKVYSKE